MTTHTSAARLVGSKGQVEHESVAITEVPPFASVYEQYFDFVWASTRRLGVGPASMDDVVQEVFIVIHGKLATLRQPESLRSWIYGIVRRTVSDHHRSRRTKEAAHPALADALVQTAPPNPFAQVEHNDQVALLSSLLEELGPEKREVFQLAEIEELSVPEIAEILAIPLNTAYSRLRAARIAFEQGLARRKARQERGI